MIVNFVRRDGNVVSGAVFKRKAFGDTPGILCETPDLKLRMPNSPRRIFRVAESSAPIAKSASAADAVCCPIWLVNWPLKSNEPRTGKEE
jgi:hypothetical protein